MKTTVLTVPLFLGLTGFASPSLKSPVACPRGFNSVAISSPGHYEAGDFDGHGNSYPEEALDAEGFVAGSTFVKDGMTYAVPAFAPGLPDHYEACGQTIDVSPPLGTSAIGILGAAANGLSGGQAAVLYDDTTETAFQLTTSDWALAAGRVPPDPTNSPAVRVFYRHRHDGTDELMDFYIFAVTVPVVPTKQVIGVRLPSTPTGGSMHVFGVGW